MKEQEKKGPEEVYICHSVEAQVQCVRQLAPHGTVAQHRVHTRRVGRCRRRFEVLDVLADAQQLAAQPKLLLDGLIGRRGGRRLGRLHRIERVRWRERPRRHRHRRRWPR